MNLQYLWTLLTSLAVTTAIMPLVIYLTKKLKFRQTILHYVDNHQSKSGTPTMGGISFLIAILIASLIFMKNNNRLMVIILVVTMGYGLVGFLDDFIKIFFKRNMGLTALQKIIFQVFIAVIVSIFCYNSSFIGSEMHIPFSFKTFDLKYLSIPINIVIFIAFTNSVNLTDGLDGLASSVSLIFTFFFTCILGLIIAGNDDFELLNLEYSNIMVFCFALMGGLIGFIMFNGYPAKIFMGDTGALALGGALAAMSIFTKLSFSILLLGVMFIVTSLSVIIQVVKFKTTGKRAFLMAPLHHHFEKKGIHENKIVTVYAGITFAAGIVSLILFYLLNF